MVIKTPARLDPRWEFDAFAKEWGFQHTTSSPNYPRSNGLAESSVKIMKALMKKSHDGKTDFHNNLMTYRSAPLQNGLSPAQMLMSQRIRTYELTHPPGLVDSCWGEQSQRSKTTT
ncbi:hypothetical protein QQF64_009493 [Cirrhinus molitorella]|uniref:Integrase catalytic domain-containing protein n=1 Tax=Cirrhinus molitorella TaxID=172907 RepID=A0ABR3M3Q6_9TELE